MRTTLTLDADVARLVADAVHSQRRSMKQVVNDALRRGLQPVVRDREPYRIAPHESAIRPGYDPAGFNRMAAEMEDEVVVELARRQP